MATPATTKSIKTLEERGLIKQISHWNQPGKKMYIMADIEPGKTTVGNTWCVRNFFLLCPSFSTAHFTGNVHGVEQGWIADMCVWLRQYPKLGLVMFKSL